MATFLTRLIVVCATSLALPASAMAAPFSFTGPASVNESAGTATYTVNCGEGSLNPILPDVPNTGVLTVSAADGPAPAATSGQDYGAPSTAAFTCPPVGPSVVTVPITNDTVDEGNEKFTVSISGAFVLGAIGPVSGAVTTTIVDDDPVASIAPVAFIVEGDSGTQAIELLVTLASAAVQTTTIPFETADLSARAGADYMTTSGDLVFQVGETQKAISIPVVGDTTPEGVEGFFVNLLSTDNGSLSATGSQGGVGIFDNDKAGLPTVSLAKKSVAVEEGNAGTGNVLFNVALSSPATERTEVKWKTGDWSADKADYDSATGRVVFQAGQKSKTVSVDVKGDRRDEADEAFTLTLESPVAATLGATKAAFGIIEDDDGPKVRISKPKVRGKRLVAKVTCPESTTGCAGVLKGKVAKRNVRKANFDLAKGESAKLKLKLSRAIREALEDKARRAKLTATATDPSGDTRKTKRKSRLKRLG